MPTYITLGNYTDKGIGDVKNAPRRLAAAKKLIAGAGGRMKAFYLTMGGYDLVTVSEAPDDETAARIALAIGAQGNVRTTTLRAFPEAEFRALVKSLS